MIKIKISFLITSIITINNALFINVLDIMDHRLPAGLWLN